MPRITGTLHEDQYTFLIISHSFRLRMRNIADKSCREHQNTFYDQYLFPRKSYRLWDNVENYGRAGQATDDSIIWRMPVTCWVPKATDIHSEHVILIAFPVQQWLHALSTVLRYAYIAYLFSIIDRPFIWRSMIRNKHSICLSIKADSHIACRAHAAPMHVPCHAVSLIHMPCRAPAMLRQCRVLRESPHGSRKYPNG
jgi:hypothetical protein